MKQRLEQTHTVSTRPDSGNNDTDCYWPPSGTAGGESESCQSNGGNIKSKKEGEEKEMNEWQQQRGKRSECWLIPIQMESSKVFCVSSFQMCTHYLKCGEAAFRGHIWAPRHPYDKATRQALLKEQTSQSIWPFHWCIQLPSTIHRSARRSNLQT